MKTCLRFAFLSMIFIVSSYYTHAQSSSETDSLQHDQTGMTKVEEEASFPGGQAGWIKYISKYLTDNLPPLRKNEFGTCNVKFIVDTHGNTSNVVAINMKKSKLAKVIISAIENGPKWIPAQQNGKSVIAYRIQPVTVTEPAK